MKYLFALALAISLTACSVHNKTEKIKDSSELSGAKKGTLIQGGEIVAERKEWAVKVFHPGGYCTGSAISPSFILTAAHCLQSLDSKPITYSAGSVYVRYSNGINNHPGDTRHYAIKLHIAPVGDIGLIELTEPHEIGNNEYAPLNFTYPRPKSSPEYQSQEGVLYGYGGHGDDAGNNIDLDALYRLKIIFNGNPTCTDYSVYGGPGFCFQGYNGKAIRGDSGGPVFVNNQVVGILSAGDYIVSGVNYTKAAWLGSEAYWIFSTAHPVSVANKVALNMMFAYGIKIK
ncbi:Uncharacterized peptidase cgR_1176 precursor [Serratia proteamaculans]|uniref:S1 family peptidase n=1 Tax=Serratia proteamaculans TaxID=28151 RepID=UPI00218377F2|nr:S1 family peptidase [Serratia proteamaculans]CAI2427880.1 Uncharacterized peptidase cgR_1176 precursor [Serratia proteamaculans]